MAEIVSVLKYQCIHPSFFY